ncbi:hypothetical protein LXL04_033921 [Taraxacum kok-saghyz]
MHKIVYVDKQERFQNRLRNRHKQYCSYKVFRKAYCLPHPELFRSITSSVVYALWLQLGLIFHIRNEDLIDCFVYDRIICKLGGVYLGKVLARKDLVFKCVHCDPPLFLGNPLFDISLIGLVGKPTRVSSTESNAAGKDDDEEWDDLDLRAASAIRLSIAKNVLAKVHGISTAKELWEKLEQLYQGKGISNRLYFKEQFHTLRMNGDTKKSDHLSVLNNIMSELEAIGVKVEGEDKALRLILSLPFSYEHMKPILMCGKETLKYADVTGKLLSEEKRLESSYHTSSSEGMVLVCGKGKKKYSQKTPVCWRCGQSGHVKRNCPGGADSVKGSETANSVKFSICTEVKFLGCFILSGDTLYGGV